MKLTKIAVACAALGLAAWMPTPAAAAPTDTPQATVQLAQYAPVYRRHYHRYYRHHHHHYYRPY